MLIYLNIPVVLYLCGDHMGTWDALKKTDARFPSQIKLESLEVGSRISSLFHFAGDPNSSHDCEAVNHATYLLQLSTNSVVATLSN